METSITTNLTKPSGLSLRLNFSWNLVGNIVYAGCQWGILVVLAKLTNPEMVGRFSLGLAVTAPIIMLSQLQLRSIQATDAKGEYEFGTYLGLRMLTTVLALLIIIVVVFCGGYFWETALVMIAVGLSKSFESVSDIYYGLMQRHERMDRIAKSRMLKGPFSLVTMGILVYLTGDVFWGVLGLAAAWGLLLFTYDLKNAAVTLKESWENPLEVMTVQKKMLPIFKINRLLHLLWLAFPLGMVMGLLSLNTNIPRYFIESYWGEGQLGMFTAIAYLIVVGNTIVSAMGQSVTPRLAKYYAFGEIGKFKKLLLRMIGAGLALGTSGVLVALFAGRPLLTILYRPEYAVHTTVFIWLMMTGGLTYIAAFLGYGITAARYFNAQLPLFIAVCVSTYISASLLIPRFSLSGAAFSLAIGAVIQILGSILVLFHVIKMRPHERIS